MAKQTTNLQIETTRRELDKAVAAVVEAWRVNNPAPSWEVEKEWEQQNPSPRSQHAAKANEIRQAVSSDADELMLKIKLGGIASEEIYAELRKVLDKLTEKKNAYLAE